jgi:hypothetical protein
MAARVDNYKIFRQKLNQLRATHDLFGFVLFDDRPSHRLVRDFCNSHFSWLDTLADSNGLTLFVPLAESADIADGYQNSSLEIARDFQLRPNQLPAFLFFTLGKDGQTCVESCVWLQFKANVFSGDANDGEEFISDLFSAVSDSRRKQTPNDLILKLKAEIDRVQRTRQMRPLKRWIKNAAVSLEDLPADIVRTVTTAGVKTALVGLGLPS